MWSLSDIAKEVGGLVQGDPLFQVTSVGTLQNAKYEQLSFLANKKYKKYLLSSRAGAVIIDKDMVGFVPYNAIIVDDPYSAYAKAARFLNPIKNKKAGIHPTASIATDAIIHPTVCIGAHVVIGAGTIISKNVEIDANCVLKNNITIGESTHLAANITICEGVTIGKRATIFPGVVIGADGFGIANDKGMWIKVPQLGSVEIGDDVDIGANTTIDCGTIENTIIGNGVKLDNQIQIAHNVVIGDNTVIAGCTGIAGSTHIGKNCIIGGGVGISGHLSIVDGVQLTGMTMVTKSIRLSGTYSSGMPAEPNKQWYKNTIHYRQMTKLIDRVKKLEQPESKNI